MIVFADSIPRKSRICVLQYQIERLQHPRHARVLGAGGQKQLDDLRRQLAELRSKPA